MDAREEKIYELLKKYFGFSDFKGQQKEVILSLLDGKDSFVLMPTGGGKSLCYQLPALMLEGTAIIISPLIALMKNQVDAIILPWSPGQEGANAIAQVLKGEINPSGKLPVTFYKSVDQLPDFENYDMKGHTYRYFEGEPAFAFGHGLSYTTFKYRRARIKNGCLVVKVKNTGKRDGEEVVQLYVSRKGDKEGPIKTLRGFKRVFIPAGKTVTVSIPLTPETFEWWNGSEMTPLKGRYTLYYGGSSDKLRKKSYKLK